MMSSVLRNHRKDRLILSRAILLRSIVVDELVVVVVLVVSFDHGETDSRQVGAALWAMRAHQTGSTKTADLVSLVATLPFRSLMITRSPF